MSTATLQKPKWIRRNDPDAPDFAKMEEDGAARYADEIHNRLEGGSLAWQVNQTRLDAFDTSAEILNAEPDALVDMVIAAKRGQSEKAMELLKELIDDAIDSVSCSRASGDIDRLYPTY